MWCCGAIFFLKLYLYSFCDDFVLILNCVICANIVPTKNNLIDDQIMNVRTGFFSLEFWNITK